MSLLHIPRTIVSTVLLTCTLSSALALDGLPKRSDALVGEALTIADSSLNDVERIFTRMAVANQLLERYPNAAREVLSVALAIGDRSTLPAIRNLAVAVTAPGLQQSGAKVSKEAVRTSVDALERFPRIAQTVLPIVAFYFAEVEPDHALQLVARVDDGAARSMLRGAIAVVIEKHNPSKAREVLSSLPEQYAIGYTAIQRIDDKNRLDAHAFLKTSREILTELERVSYGVDPQLLYSVLAGISVGEGLRQEEPRKAEELLQRSISIARQLSGPGPRVAGIAMLVANTLGSSRAEPLFDEALHLARSSAANDKVQAATELVQVAISMRASRQALARKVAAEAEAQFRASQSTSPPMQRVFFLASLAAFNFPPSSK